MKRWTLVFALALAFAVGAVAQEKVKPAAKPATAPAAKANPAAPAAAPAMDAKQKAAMEAMTKAGAIGAPHKKLAELAGKWEATVKMWQGPGEPQVAKGTSEVTVELGGRFIKESFKSTMDGQPFEGFGYTGYDNVAKKYVGIWMDSMTTGIMTGTGKMDAAGKVYTGTDVSNDPMTGKAHAYKTIVRYTDNDNHTMEMYDKGPDGKEFKMMEIAYKRVK